MSLLDALRQFVPDVHMPSVALGVALTLGTIALVVNWLLGRR